MAITAAVIAAGTAVYMNQQQKKAAAKAQAAAGNGALPQFKAPPMPGYIPLDFRQINDQAIRADTAGYARSDTDFKRRHPGTVEAEQLFEAQTLKDQRGDTELLPALQSEYMRAGLGGALDAFGDTGGATTLAPGSAGEASVARNLGVSIMGFQDRNRNNRQRALSMAEDIFPRRQFGMSGQDLALMALTNNQNQNTFNSANYASEMGVKQFNYGVNAENANARTTASNANAQAQAAANAETAKALAGVATSAVGAYGEYRAAHPAAAKPATVRYPGAQQWVANPYR